MVLLVHFYRSSVSQVHQSLVGVNKYGLETKNGEDGIVSPFRRKHVLFSMSALQKTNIEISWPLMLP